jgi:hypothetical protein
VSAVRAGTVDELARLLHGRHAGLALAARLTLERLTNDDSRTVAAAAIASLGVQTQPGQALVDPTPLPAPRTAVTTRPEAEPELSEGARPGAQQEASLSKAAPTPLPTPTASTGGAVVGSAAELPLTPIGVDRRPASQARDERRLPVVGGLAILGAALTIVGLFPAYAEGVRLASDSESWYASDNIWYAGIVAALVLRPPGGSGSVVSRRVNSEWRRRRRA